MVATSRGRQVDQSPDQASRRARTSVASPETLILATARTALEKCDLDCAVRRILKTIDPSASCSIRSPGRLQGQLHKKRHHVITSKMMTTVEFVAEMFGRSTTARSGVIELHAKPVHRIGQDALFDDGVDRALHSPQNEISFDRRSFPQASDHGADVVRRRRREAGVRQRGCKRLAVVIAEMAWR